MNPDTDTFKHDWQRDLYAGTGGEYRGPKRMPPPTTLNKKELEVIAKHGRLPVLRRFTYHDHNLCGPYECFNPVSRVI